MIEKIVVPIFLLCISDKILKKTSNFFKRDNSRWYFMHFVTNMFLVNSTKTDVLLLLADPTKNILVKRSVMIYPVINLHLYHIIMFRKKLTKIDFCHHFFNCFISGYVALKFSSDISILTNYFIFFMC